MEEEIEDEFYCGEPNEEKKRGFTEEYKLMMKTLTDMSKKPWDGSNQKSTKGDNEFRPIDKAGNFISTNGIYDFRPTDEGHHISDHDFVRLWQRETSIIDLLNACNNFEDAGGWTVVHTIREILNRATYLRRKGVNLKEYVI